MDRRLTDHCHTNTSIPLAPSAQVSYNPFLVYCHELAPSTVSLTGDRAQGDDSKHDSHYKNMQALNFRSNIGIQDTFIFQKALT